MQSGQITVFLDFATKNPIRPQIVHTDTEIRTDLKKTLNWLNRDQILGHFIGINQTYTLSIKGLYGHSSLCYKSTLNTDGVGWAGAATPTSALRTFLSWPLAQSVPIHSNFQINGAS